MTQRRVLLISGRDAQDFLQNLVTNDVTRVNEGLVYAALLSPQGKFLCDFLLCRDPSGGGFLLDVAEDSADALIRRLTMYRLRSDATIAPSNLHLHRGLDETPADGFADPRHPALGWRAYRDAPPPPAKKDATDWDAIRVAHCIPETGIELGPDTYILEAGFEALNGVDFRKGCYVGQEVTARMKHKTTLRKGLAVVEIDGKAESGAEILSESGRPAGTLHTRSGNRAIAYLRHDRTSGTMRAGDAKLRLAEAFPGAST